MIAQTIESADEASNRAEEYRIKLHGLEDLMATISAGDTVKKVVEWQAKMEILRLSEMRHTRTAAKLQRQVSEQCACIQQTTHLRPPSHQINESDAEIAELESTIAAMEETQTKLQKVSNSFA